MYHHSEVIDLCVHDYKVDHCLAYLFQSNTCQTVVLFAQIAEELWWR